MNYKYVISNTKFFLKTPTFKILYIVALLLIFSITLATKQTFPYSTYFELFNWLLYTPSFVLLGFFLIFLFSGFDIYFRFEKNHSYIIRLKSKRKYLTTLLSNIWIANTFLFLILLLTIMIILNIFGNNFSLGNYSLYGINNLLYLCWSLVRIFLLANMTVIISVLLFKFISPKLVVITNIMMYAITMMQPITNHAKSSIFEMSFWIGHYISLERYDSFLLEINSTVLFLLLLFAIIILLYWANICFMKRVGD